MVFVILSSLLFLNCNTKSTTTYLLNVSYDPTREMFTELNQIFERENPNVQIFQSHAGSSKQANLVLSGLRADVLTLAMETDIEKISKRGFISPNWKTEFPNNSTPYYSTIIFLVREGNPKKIRTWEDLQNAQIITPNPKTSGGGKWNFLAMYGYFLIQGHPNPKEEVRKILKNTLVFDSSSRSSASTFLQRKMGDVLIAWENEALLALREKVEPVEIVYPPISIYASPMVAVVERTTKLKNTYELAKNYLNFLYTQTAQEIIAKHGFRPTHPKVEENFSHLYSKLQLFTVEQVFGGWEKVEKEIFANGKILDEVLE